MKITDYHYIKSLTLPDDWIEVESIDGGFNAQTVRSFAPKDNPAVRIELFYRGLPVSQVAAKILRTTLSLAPNLIFDLDNKNKLSATDLQLLGNLEEVLGNIGNNQLVNKQSGIQGPPFMLIRLETLIWNTKPLLAARGYFKNPEDNNRVSEFCGFFIDADPKASSCRVEEIYLQAPSPELHMKYLPAFQQGVSSLEWLSK